MKVVILCSKGDSSAIVYNELKEQFDIAKVIVENDVPKKVFIKNRIKKLGLFKVIGQIFFTVLIVPVLKKKSATRKQEILKEYGIDTTPNYLNASNTIRVESVNSPECIKELREANPDVVVVNGTRIIKKDVLDCVKCPFINMHTGITPKYRGVHGAYWALRNHDKENAGVTIHLVDEGIDTGTIIYQDTIKMTEKDNFTTYPLLQTGVGVKYEVRALNDIKNNNLKLTSNDLPSGLYSHPTFFGYIYHRIKFGVK